MKKYLFLYVLLTAPLFLEAQSWEWAVRLPYQWGSAMTTDHLGNIFVTGQTDTSLLIGINTRPDHGTFVTKFTSSGDSLWTKTFWGGRSRTIATDEAGHIFIAGEFFDTALVWDGHEIRNARPSNRWCAFLAMLDSSGNCMWIRGDSSMENCSGLKVAVDPPGNVYLSGAAAGIAKFGHVTLPHYGTHSNAYLAKYNVVGDLIWVVSGTAGDGLSLAIDKLGNIYQAGELEEDEISFGAYTCVAEPLPGGAHGGYLVRFDSDGNAIWAKARKDGSGFSGWYVAASNDGNIFVVSPYDGTYVAAEKELYVKPGDVNLALTKYSSSGDLVAAKCVARGHFMDSDDICVDDWGNIFISGSSSPGAMADSVYFDNVAHACVPYSMPSFVEYNRCGEHVYSAVLGNSVRNYGEIWSLASFDSTLYVFGTFGNYGITFDDYFVPSTWRSHDCFLAKWKGEGGVPDCAPMVVNDIRGSAELTLFPNPANFNITISLNEEIIEVVVYNQFGQEVETYKFGGGNHATLQIGSLLPGFYYARVNDKVTKYFVKF